MGPTGPILICAVTTSLRQQIAEEAARLVCDDQLTDYRLAKQKALARMGLSAKTPLPDNAQLHTAVLAYLRTFGGDAYVAHLRRLRQTALDALRLLREVDARLVGAVVSGAVTTAHRVQIHAFADRAETLEMTLHNKGIRCEQDDRRYRYPNGDEAEIPLIRFEADGVGVDIAVFETGTQYDCPLSPLDGRPCTRLDLAAVERLIQSQA